MTMNQDWHFSQCFGEKLETGQVNETDIISALKFDPTGRYLATGDRGGRVVLFEAIGSDQSGASYAKMTHSPDYKFFHEFQSHEPEFDYLKSLEIEEKINCIRWCKPSNDSLYLLSTNDKTIKLWKVHEKEVKTVSQFNVISKNGRRLSLADFDDEQPTTPRSSSCNMVPNLKIPKITKSGRTMSSYTRRVYANAHAYHINSISLNSDYETFLSADDLRINLWNLHRSDQSYTIVDMKPENMEELTEVITSAVFHPIQCHLFMYSSSRGSARLGDMRAGALCDSSFKIFEEPEQSGSNSFFSEIISSIADVKFTPDGRYIVARDYLNVRIWDMRLESRPVKTIKVHDYLRPVLSELYDNECIFDKFELELSGDGMQLATGSYGSKLYIHDMISDFSECINVSMFHGSADGVDGGGPLANSKKSDFIDYNRKITNLSWNPHFPVMAIADLNNLFIYKRF